MDDNLRSNKLLTMICLLLIFVLQPILGKNDLELSFFNRDQCLNICEGISTMNYDQNICQRGCRFYNILRYKYGISYQSILNECYSSCNESYREKIEEAACVKGCNLMENQTLIILSNLIEMSRSAGLALNSGWRGVSKADIALLESELQQLETNDIYGIPKSHIRTLSIEIIQDDRVPTLDTVSKDWLDCASRNSGIPRLILLTAILLAVLLTLWVAFATEQQIVSLKYQNVEPYNIVPHKYSPSGNKDGKSELHSASPEWNEPYSELYPPPKYKDVSMLKV